VLTVVHDEAEPNATGVAALGSSLLDEIVRDGARQMLAAGLRAEVVAYIEAHRGELDKNGHRLVVRNGYHAEREVTTAAGAVSVRQPRVNDKRIDPVTGERVRFSSAILPAWARKSPKVSEVLPLLSARPFDVGFRARAGAVPGQRTRPVRAHHHPADRAVEGRRRGVFNARSLADVDYVYMWVDGIHLKVRLEQDKVCLLVMIGVRADGTKELIALADGFRESSESWADLLRDCKRRGMRAPVLAVGDGALGFWKALREVFPETREQRCWFHVQANVLAALPKSAHPGAKKALAEIFNAEDREHALKAVKTFAADYGAKWPKAVARSPSMSNVLLAFYAYPAEHWIHLRTTNPIESTFATVRLRQRVTKGPGSRAAGIAMAFKLIEAAQTRWRAVNAPHLVALVRAGARFENGKLLERPDESGGDQQAA